MRLTVLYRGARFEIAAINRSNEPTMQRCPAVEFLEGLDMENRKSLTARIARLGDHGPSRNAQHSRWLDDRFFEVKTRRGARLVCYYDPEERGRIIATHGFLKPTRAGPEIRKAAALRDDFERDRWRQRKEEGRGR